MSKLKAILAVKNVSQVTLLLVLSSYGAQVLAQPSTQPKPGGVAPANKSIIDAVDKISIPRANHTHKVPTNFPLPVYKSNVVGTQFTNTTEGIPMASLVIATHDDVQTVVNWYKQQCSSQGWTIKLPKEPNKTAAEKSGNVYLMQGQKGTERAIITCAKGKKGFETSINITWQKHD